MDLTTVHKHIKILSEPYDTDNIFDKNFPIDRFLLIKPIALIILHSATVCFYIVPRNYFKFTNCFFGSQKQQVTEIFYN